MAQQTAAPKTEQEAWEAAPTRMAERHDWQRYLFVAPALALLAVMLIYPVVYNVWTSLYDVTVGNFVRGGAPFVGLQNYRTVIASDVFQNALWVSIVFTVGSLLFQFTIGFALALFFNRPFPGNGLLRALMLLGWMLPLLITGSLFRWMLDGDYGLINLALTSLGILDRGVFWLTEPSTALAGVILANVWVGIPFNMALLLAGLKGIPESLYEAASVDGAGAWGKFLHITLPMMRPVSLTVLLLGVVYTFKVFDLIFVMTAGGPVNATTVLTILVYDLTFEFFRFGEGAAAANLLLLVPLILAFFYVRATRRDEMTL